MQTLPKVIKDLLVGYPDHMRVALRRLAENPQLQSVSFLDRDGESIIIQRVHPR